MQLRVARLCLDCEEVHASQQCPVCASETFAFLSRWVAAPERRTTSRPAGAEQRPVASQPAGGSRAARLLTQGMVGLTAVGLAGWFWRSLSGDEDARPEPRKRSGDAGAAKPPHS